MPDTNDTIWLTQEAYDKLAEELEYLKTEGRAAVTREIAAARAEGDLSENGGYHAARDKQGQQEARIAQLEHTLREAQVGQPPAASDGQDGTAGVGSEVTVAYFGDPDDTESFLLGSREILRLDASVEMTVYSPQSPLGAAVLGTRKGDEISYTAPNGKTIELTVLDVTPFAG